MVSAKTGALITFPVALAVFFFGLQGDFVFDDKPLVRDNTWLRGPGAFSRLLGLGEGPLTYRPVRNLSYALDHRIWELEPAGYHLTNVFLHGACGFLVLLLARRLGLSPPGVIVATLLFVVHPVQVDSVTYISGRRDVLFTFFYLLGLMAFLEFRRGSRIAGFGLIACYVLSLFTKEMGITLPAVCLVLDWLAPGERCRSRWIHPLLLVIGAVFGVFAAGLARTEAANMTGTIGKQYYGGALGLTFLTIARVFLFYYYLFAFPKTLSCYYKYDAFPVTRSYLEPWSWLAVVLHLAIVVAAYRKRHSFPLGAIGIFWFYLALAPVSQVIPHREMMAEHYLYLPSIGIFLVLGEVAGRWLAAGGRARVGLVGIWILLLSARTMVRTFDWADDYTLWRSAVEAYPRCVGARTNLALALQAMGERPAAREQFEKAFEIDPTDAINLNGLAVHLLGDGEVGKAKALFEAFLASNPNNAPGRQNYGTCLREMGRLEEAQRELEAAVSLDPSLLMGWVNLGVTRKARGPAFHDAARDAYRRALQLDPSSMTSLNNLAALELDAGHPDRAVALYDEAIARHPDVPALRLNRARALVRLGKKEEALQGLRSAMAEATEEPALLREAAELFLELGDEERARLYHEKAKGLGEQDPELEKRLAPPSPGGGTPPGSP